MDQVRLESDGWSRDDVALAATFRTRWRGLKAPGVEAVLIETRSVHSLGMSFPFRAVGLGADLSVRESRVVKPNRIAYFRDSRFVLELPLDAEAPEQGSSLVMRHV